MKRKIIGIILFLAAMTAFSQNMNMDFMYRDYTRADSSFADRLVVLETVRDAELTGIGEFYHEALRYFLLRSSDIRTIEDRYAAEATARLLAQGLGAEQYTPAAQELWQLAVFYDVVRDPQNQGLEMQDALIALGEIGAMEFLPHIVQRLDDLNTVPLADVETRRRIQRAVVGCINALELLADPAGFRPVFFVSIGAYDPSIRAMASVALPNIMEDPGEIIIGIIQNPANNPPIKYEAFREMLRTNAPDESIARVASAALAIGWTYSTSNAIYIRSLGDLRKSAIDAIRIYGAADDSIYTNLRRSYVNNLAANSPDIIEMEKTLHALAVLGTEEAVELLMEFLRELHNRRLVGPWRVDRERHLFQWVLVCLGASGTDSMDARLLLTTIQRTPEYTGVEQSWAANTMRDLGF